VKNPPEKPEQFILQRAQELWNVRAACRELGVSRTSFYRWKRKLAAYGVDGLRPHRKAARPGRPSSLSPAQQRAIVASALHLGTPTAVASACLAGDSSVHEHSVESPQVNRIGAQGTASAGVVTILGGESRSSHRADPEEPKGQKEPACPSEQAGTACVLGHLLHRQAQGSGESLTDYRLRRRQLLWLGQDHPGMRFPGRSSVSQESGGAWVCQGGLETEAGADG